jgi:hypothetical protein
LVAFDRMKDRRFVHAPNLLAELSLLRTKV